MPNTFRTRTDDQRSVNPSKGPGVDPDAVDPFGGNLDGDAPVRANAVTVATEGGAGANLYTVEERAAAKRKLVTG